jgi:predicted RNase H-like HicB family nuclease
VFRSAGMRKKRYKMTSKIAVCLEVGPEATGAFVPDCPGCWVFGRTKGSALKKARSAVVDWIEGLRRQGGEIPHSGRNLRVDLRRQIEIEVAEMMKIAYNPAKAGKPEPLFWSEVLPVTRDDIKRTIWLMKYSRQDLLELVSHLTEEQLNFKPPDQTRTIKNCLKHIAYVEPWYINRLNIELPEDYPKDVFEFLNYTRKIVVNSLSDLPREKMRGVHQPVKYKSPTCDLWTARKVLRRLVDHERLHTRYIQKVLKMYPKI